MLNEVRLIGRLGNDPEIKVLENDKNVATLSVATYESFKNKNGDWEQITEWHRVVVWNRKEQIKKIKKGQLILVAGKLKTRVWEKDGANHYTTEIIGFVKLFPNTNGNAPTGNSENMQNHNNDNSGEGEDLPF